MRRRVALGPGSLGSRKGASFGPLAALATVVLVASACGSPDSLLFDSVQSAASTGGNPSVGAGGGASGGAPSSAMPAGGAPGAGGSPAAGGGVSQAGGADGSGGAVVVLGPPSCQGLPATCGPSADEDCCASPLLPSGSFNRYRESDSPAQLSELRLDRFEVTVGRFRRFVAAYDAWREGGHPELGEGAHPVAQGMGWTEARSALLPESAAALVAALSCSDTASTYTQSAGGNEHLPVNCVNWYVAAAFCTWDGGWLPTETENNYARLGGSQNRLFPWCGPTADCDTDVAPTSDEVVYACQNEEPLNTCILPVGSKPLGDGRFGQADLAGGLAEWSFDWEVDLEGACADCVASTPEGGADTRTLLGGSWASNYTAMFGSSRGNAPPEEARSTVGLRCARRP